MILAEIFADPVRKGYGQTDFVRMTAIENVDITRETLVKIERGIQLYYWIPAQRNYGIVLILTYDELLK